MQAGTQVAVLSRVDVRTSTHKLTVLVRMVQIAGRLEEMATVVSNHLHKQITDGIVTTEQLLVGVLIRDAKKESVGKATRVRPLVEKLMDVARPKVEVVHHFHTQTCKVMAQSSRSQGLVQWLMLPTAT
mmetsp:Transcript_105205/g.209136  ORF Transcript_105205/g.209136 Transcript_105205/m.209136 type:complete len:129 (-) Transcript_105205:3074-3460(-)